MSHDLLLAKTIPECFTEQMYHDFAGYAMAVHPNEACAIVLKGELIKIDNISENPTEEFSLSLSDSKLVMEAECFIHSHPDGQLRPSKEDMQSQIECGIPFGIVTCTDDSCSSPVFWGDHLLEVELVGRPFIHGVYDCYSLIRAEHYQRTGRILPDFARSDEWWEAEANSNEDMYETNFSKAGYVDVDNSQGLLLGDGIFMKINSKVSCHAAVYIGDGLILHHLRDRLSRIEHVTTWKKFREKTVRYTNDDNSPTREVG